MKIPELQIEIQELWVSKYNLTHRLYVWQYMFYV